MSDLKGELRLLYEELNSQDPDVKKDALKKTIVYMSVGRDVSPIFQTVIRCLEINDIEMKKLIYLYIINYSQSRPKDAIMVINQFCRDVDKKINNKPLIRALAFRTMGCLRVKELNEYLINPLNDGLKDPNSYVRKTAVMCVPKMYEITPELVDRADMINTLKDIFEKDGNTQVVANCVQALIELSQLR
jgi:vesicle coat complex subunit